MTMATRQPGRAYRFSEATDASFLAPVPAVYTKAIDSKRLSVTAVLTYPVPDLAGDEVKSDGGDWSHHKSMPWVGLEHHRYFTNDHNRSGLLGQPGVGNEPVVVAWTTEDRNDPDSPYTVELKSFNLDGETHVLPVGTSFFDPSDRLSAQTFAMVASDALPGVSLEFAPVLKARRQRLAQSPLERRPAYHFDRWDALGYVHCAVPVNPGAMVCKSVQAASDELLKALTDKRVGREPMHGILFKSLSRYLPVGKSRTTVRVEKAMPDDPNAPTPTAYDDAMPEQPAEDTAPPLNGVQAFLNHAQALLGILDQLEQDIQSSDSSELRKAATKMVAEGRKCAAKCESIANKHDAKLNGTEAPEDDEPEEGDEETDAEDDEDDDDSELDDGPETDDDGVLKSVRACYRAPLVAIHKALTVRRIPLSEVRKAAPVTKSGNVPVVKTTPEPDGDSPEDIAYLEAAIAADDRASKKLRRAAKL